MQTFVGMILGALLLVGGVYIYDSLQTSSVASGQVAQANRTIVNWDVAKADWDKLTTRAHEGPLMDEKSRVTVGIGWRRTDDVFIAFDAWAKRYTGSSSSVHTRRALVDAAIRDGSGKDGPRHDPRFGFDVAHAGDFVTWARSLRAAKVAVLAPHEPERGVADAVQVDRQSV